MKILRIELSNGMKTLVDEDMFPFLKRFKWNYSGGYALTRFRIAENKSYSVAMQRLLMKMSSKHVDHINGNKLDNRVSNLRFASRSQNMINFHRLNKTGFRGVYRNTDISWSSRITVNSQRITIGTFDSPKKAAEAYDLAALKHHGEFAVLNFPKAVLEDSDGEV